MSKKRALKLSPYQEAMLYYLGVPPPAIVTKVEITVGGKRVESAGFMRDCHVFAEWQAHYAKRLYNVLQYYELEGRPLPPAAVYRGRLG